MADALKTFRAKCSVMDRSSSHPSTEWSVSIYHSSLTFSSSHVVGYDGMLDSTLCLLVNTPCRISLLARAQCAEHFAWTTLAQTWCRGLGTWSTNDVVHPPSPCQGSRTLVQRSLPWEAAMCRNAPRAIEWARSNMTLSWCSKFMPKNGCPQKAPRNVHRSWSNHTMRNSTRLTSSGLKKGLFAGTFPFFQRKKYHQYIRDANLLSSR